MRRRLILWMAVVIVSMMPAHGQEKKPEPDKDKTDRIARARKMMAAVLPSEFLNANGRMIARVLDGSVERYGMLIPADARFKIDSIQKKYGAPDKVSERARRASIAGLEDEPPDTVYEYGLLGFASPKGDKTGNVEWLWVRAP